MGAGHALGVAGRAVVAPIAAALRKAVVRSLAVFRAELAAIVPSSVLVLAGRANVAGLLVDVRLKARLALAASGGQVPLAVPLAQVRGGLHLLRVVHALARGLLYHRHLAARRCCREAGEVDRCLRTGDVVHLDGEERDAGALVPESEVHALLVDGDGLDLRVDDHFAVGGLVEAALSRGDATDHLVALGLPGWRLFSRRVELVVQQREGLLAGERVAGEQGAVPDGELDLDVDAVGDAALDEGRPQPVVDAVVGHVAHHVRPPVDALVEVGERLLHPPWCDRVGSVGKPGPF